MSNQNPKSDEMLKSYVAQIASQGVAMFLQQRQENEVERLDHAETENELRSRIQWLTDKCEEFEAEIDNQNEHYSSLKELNANLKKDCDRYQILNRQGGEQVEKLKNENANLKIELESYRKEFSKSESNLFSASNEIWTLKSQITALKSDRDDYRRRYEDLRDRTDDPLADVLASIPDSNGENAKVVGA